MRLETLFHFSFYLTLALATACLTLPATFFLWWMPFFFGAVFVVLVVSWRQEGRWILSETAANQIGVFLAIAGAGWLLFQIPRSEDDLIAGGVNWPAGLLPHLGPFLVILLMVKLFRPKRLPDYWVIQTLGLIIVGLATVLAEEQMFGALLAIYLMSLLWSLALYYPIRERALQVDGTDASATPLFAAARTAPSLTAPWRWWGLPRAAGWTAAVAVGGYLLFLTAPRHGQTQWSALQLSTRTRGAGKTESASSMDLNRTGRIELSEEPAFTVTVRNHLGQIKDPAVISRWRVESLELYSGGRWYPFWRTPVMLMDRIVAPSPVPTRALPETLAEDQLLITFHVKPHDAGGFVLAEPVNVDLGIGLAPHLEGQPTDNSLFAVVEGCDSFGMNIRNTKHTFSYSQVMRPSKGDASPVLSNLNSKFTALLVEQPTPAPLRLWTRELLARLPGLSEANRKLDENLHVAPDAHVQVAEALCRHLASSGEYRYSLDLRRQESAMDPTADFLINVKEGHCERYAGGLALMLRVLGIRSRVVKGYLAAETDETGQGLVRLSQAHSWVEALVPGPEPGTWRWLPLDPTPGAQAQETLLHACWRWLNQNFDVYAFWRHYIMDFEADQQASFWRDLGRWLVSKRGAVTVLLLAGMGLAVFRGRRFASALAAGLSRCHPWSQSSADARCFDALVRLLVRHGGPPRRPGQTPGEYAAVAAALLTGNATTSDYAALPHAVVAAYYRARFGGQAPSAAETGPLLAQLRALRGRLAGVQLASSL